MTDINSVEPVKPLTNCLRFNLKTEWFNKIKNGQKEIEYREVKPYWDKRIRNLYHFNNSANYNKCVFVKGYTKEYLTAEITAIQVVYGGNTDLHVNKNVYAIHFKLKRQA